MTPDLQARIEAAARELDDKLYREIFGDRTKDVARMGTSRLISQALTTLATSIIAEKDAEAVQLRERVRELGEHNAMRIEMNER